jgi:hypothetical protein
MQQIKIHKNLKAGSTYIYIPNWVSNALGLIKGEKLWMKLEDKRIIFQREKPEVNSEQGEGKHEGA